MARKKTHEEFINNVFELVGNEYAVLGEYQGNKIKIEMIKLDRTLVTLVMS